ncbi:MAG TPA: glycosyltransferase [Jiangellaceae bacterium]|nr:glycosyltransferase [Jiangellaceae bacterium]
MPRDVAECIASWDRLVDDVPRLSRVMFDDDTARQFIRDELSSDHAAVFDACRHPAMRCDYFRLCFLLRHGGLYVDADEVYLGGLGPELLAGARLKLQPLCYNIATDEMVAAEVFLEAARVGSRRELPDHAADARDARIWTHYVNNNPLVAPAGHPVIQSALGRATRLLEREAAGVGRSLGVHQSTTGPGNLTAALVAHALELAATGDRAQVSFMENWDEVSVSRWPLEYRNDERNRRLWNPNR